LYVGTGLMLVVCVRVSWPSGPGVNPQTLRYYERRGLLTPPGRSRSGYRDYPVEALARLRFITRAQALGFSLDEAEDLLQLAAGGPAACDAARRLAGTRLADARPAWSIWSGCGIRWLSW
jgi:DNA-binding transcriptional MerR regulator